VDKLTEKWPTSETTRGFQIRLREILNNVEQLDVITSMYLETVRKKHLDLVV
jgi:hypothetical protein